MAPSAALLALQAALPGRIRHDPSLPDTWMIGTTAHQRRVLGAFKRQIEIPVKEAGSVRVRLDEAFVAKLGESAFRVYDALLSRRDRNGLTTVTVRGIARATGAGREETNLYPRKPMAERTIKSALARLVQAGLVFNGGWGYRDVPCHCCPEGWGSHEVFLRRVFGQIEPEPGVQASMCLRVQPETAAWLREATVSQHGGKRKGAGRPAGTKDKGARRRYVDPTEGLSDAALDGPFPTAPLAGCIRPGDMQEKSSCPPIRSISRSSLALALQEQSKIPAPLENSSGADPSSPTEKQDPPAEQEGRVAAEGHEHEIRPLESGPLPAVAGGCGGAAGLVAFLPSAEIPPMPAEGVIDAVRIPAPPRLDPRHSDDAWVKKCVAAYVEVAQHRFGAAPHGASAAAGPKSHHYAKVLACAKLLVEQKIAPIAWVAWSMDVWKGYAQGKAAERPPPLSWVWDPGRIEKRHGWFHNEQWTYGGGRVVYSQTHLDLARRWFSMQRELQRGGDVREVVARHFPPGEYDRLVNVARRETEEIKSRLEGQLKSGVFLW